MLDVLGLGGLPVDQDYAQAMAWFKKAADQDFASAQNNIGWMYQQGEGVSKDYTKALKWYRKAASQGNPNAEQNLIALNNLI